ncbi:tyrosine-type recombinase/integrase [Mesorhizobium amorphae]|uniref:tyrosine-type recombinase/integrase n=1 Tax=Mesorhizobium amorphae TaxID=71433 RepID=UPI003F5057E3
MTPHSFRHATAVHLVSAGVDVTVIRSWLGHVSLDTTNVPSHSCDLTICKVMVR